MRKDAAQEDWGPLVTRVRKDARLSKAAFARLVEAHVDTIGRWEAGSHRPKDSETVERFAKAAGVDLTYALKAARLLPESHGDPGIRPPEDEPAVAILKASSLPEFLKAEYLDELKHQSTEDMERRRRWVEKLLKAAGRTGLNKPDAPR